MKLNILAAPLAGLALLSLCATAMALPIKSTPGQDWCQCSCRTGTDIRDLSWKMGSTCNSNGKTCNLINGGKATPGKLGDCAQCKAEDGGWKCTPTGISVAPGGVQRRNP